MHAHILLVDDDTILSDLLKTYLEGEGFQVSQAFDGEEALTQCQSNPFSCLVLDIMMPKLNGLDTLKQLRTAQHNTPVIMLSARGEAFDKIIGLEFGADDYLSKPCDPRELVARIKAIIKRT